MPVSFFSPDDNNVPEASDLFALPFNWMTTACMESGFKRLSGWLGLSPVASVSRAFTCRIQARPGIYGVKPRSAVPGNPGTALFEISYFPAPDDPLIDRFSLPAAIAIEAPDVAHLIRDFPAYPEFSDLFFLAELRLSLTHPRHELALALSAPLDRLITVPRGVKSPDGEWVVVPDGLEENLPAFEIAGDLFRVLAAGVAASRGRIPDVMAAAENGAPQRIRDDDGKLQADLSREAVIRTEALSWGKSALCAFPAFPMSVDPEQYRLVRVAAGLELAECGVTMTTNKPQLVVLSGFLGSGKTSFLNQFIEFHLAHNRLVGVIQNEIGETGVDANLLEGEDSVLALDAGCVCCSLAGSLTRGLRQLNSTLSPEFVVLETTGLANPMNMVDEFLEIADLAELHAVVTIVDASRYHKNLQASDVAQQQIIAADTVILNKCDLINDDDRISIESHVRTLNSRASIVSTTNGRVNPSLLGQGLSQHAHRTDGHVGQCYGETEHHGHGVTHMEEGFSVLRYSLAYRVDGGELKRLLATMPPEVLRVKGIARIDESDKPWIIQYVPGHADFQPSARDVHETPFVLVIGRNLDANRLRALWLPLMAEDSLP